VRDLAAAARLFQVLQERPSLEHHQRDLHTGVAQEVELGRARGLAVGPDDGSDAEPEPRQREGAVGHRAAEAPAARIVTGDIS
jgi:hypothetical protein